MISRVLDKFKNRLQSYRDKKDLLDSSSVNLDVLEIYNKSSYNHSKQDIAFYKKYVKHNFKDFPAEMKNLLKFTS